MLAVRVAVFAIAAKRRASGHSGYTRSFPYWLRIETIIDFSILFPFPPLARGVVCDRLIIDRCTDFATTVAPFSSCNKKA